MILLPDSENKFIYETIVKPKDKDFLFKLEEPNDIPIYEYVFSHSMSEELFRKIPESKIEVLDKFPNAVKEHINLGEKMQANYYLKSMNTYTNPLHSVYFELMKMIKDYELYPLLQLFNKFKNFDRNRELEILEQASDMIKRLQDSSLDNKTVSNIIQKLWPKFGYFATHIYDNIEFITNENSIQYDIQMLNNIYKHMLYCEENGLIMVPEQRRDFLHKIDIKNKAEDNAKVLSLAKSVNDRIGSNR